MDTQQKKLNKPKKRKRGKWVVVLKKLEKCDKCQNYFENISKLRAHTCLDDQEIEENDGNNFQKCNFCDNYFFNEDLQKHVKQKHMKNEIKQEIEIIDIDLPALKTEIVFTNSDHETIDTKEAEDIGDHEMADSKRNRVECDKCDKTFSSKANLKVHVTHKHEGKRYSCEKCLKIFTDVGFLRKHSCKFFKCGTCNKNFKNGSKLMRHARIDHSIKEWDCPTCKENIIVTELHIHDFVFLCKHCDGRFLTKPELQNHECQRKKQPETEEREFKCKLCPGSFSRVNDFINHNLEHEKDQNVQQVLEAKNSNFSCERCHKIFNNESIWKEHSCKFYQCNTCHKHFENAADLMKHAILDHSKDAVVFQLNCNHCNESFTTRNLLEDHLKKHKENALNFTKDSNDNHEEEIVTINKEEENIPTNTNKEMKASVGKEQVTVNFDDKTVQDIDDERSESIIEVVNNQCGKCGRRFTCKGDVKRHIRFVHNKFRFECNKCEKKYVDKRNLNSHILKYHQKEISCEHTNITHNIKLKDCKTCKENLNLDRIHRDEFVLARFDKNNDLHDHNKGIVQLRKGFNKPFKCDTCIILFKSGSDLIKHASRCHGESLNKCDICMRKASLEDKTHSHIFQHFKCLKCCNYFKERSDFEIHLCKKQNSQKIINTNCKCDQCGKFFSKKENLKYHIKHTHDKVTYKCKICDKSFIDKRVLARHMDKYHEEVEGKHKCRQCEKYFHSKLNIKRHVADKHLSQEQSNGDTTNEIIITRKHQRYQCKPNFDEDATKWKCNKCSETFKNEISFKKHVLKFSKCITCNLRFTSGIKLAIHAKRCHGISSEECDKCKDSSNIEDCQSHCHEYINFKCSKCDNAFQNKVEFMSHSCPQKILTCNACDKQFSTKIFLRYHIQNQHLKKNFECNICEKEFSKKKQLNMHLDESHQGSDGNYSCNSCKKKFNSRYNFYRHLQFKKLKRQLLPTKPESNNDTFEEKSDNTTSILKCGQCEKNYSSLFNLKRHKKIHNENRAAIKCTICEKSLSSQPVLTRHMATCHATKICELCKSSVFEDNILKHACKLFRCDNCAKNFEKMEEFIKHVKIHHTLYLYEHDICQEHSKGKCQKLHAHEFETFPCDNCGQQLNSKIMFMKHVCLNGDKHSCNKCDKTFSTRLMLKKHLDSSHYAKQIQIENRCNHCENVFDSKEDFKKHVIDVFYTHSENGSFGCKECNKTFSGEKNLIYHIHHSHMKRRYECEMCEKSFADKRYIKKHVAISHGKTRTHLKCDFCDKYYFSQNTLMKHMILTHDAKKCEHCQSMKVESRILNHICKLFRCENCDKNFAKVGYLKNHAKVEHGIELNDCDICQEKNEEKILKLHAHEFETFKCNTCDKQFNCKIDISKHKCSNGKKNQCEKCLKTFSSRKILEKHERNVHILQRGQVKEEKFKCIQCNREYKTNSDLETHLLVNHNNLTDLMEAFDDQTKNVAADGIVIEEKASDQLQSDNENIITQQNQFCKSCERNFDGLQDHICKFYKCDTCEKYFEAGLQLMQHTKEYHDINLDDCKICLEHTKLEKVHKHQFVFGCNKCSEKFDKASNLQDHMKECGETVILDQLQSKSQLKKKLFGCNMCSEKFEKGSELQGHLRQCYENVKKNQSGKVKPRKNQCNRCEKAFLKPSDLKRHINSVHDKIRHECNNCGRKFADKRHLNNHIKQHHDPKNNTSDISSVNPMKTSKNSNEDNHILKEHQKSSKPKEKINENPLANLMAECTDLMEEYNETEPAQEQPNSTRHHNHAPQIVSLSSKIALSKCDQCDKSFIDKLCLENHIQDKHKNELYSYICNICDLVFGSKDELEKHQKTNHKSMSEAYHKCNKCKKGFTSIDLLNLHVKFVCVKNFISMIRS